jgi:hypothetical protein
MENYSLQDLTSKLGQEPRQWTFMGQCYDAGEKNQTRCAVTLNLTHICFTLKLKSGKKGRMTISPEAIPAFERWNPDLYVKLRAGQMFLELRAQAVAADIKATRERARLVASEKQYNKVYSEARTRIRNYRSNHRKEKMPEYLEALKFLMQRPGLFFEEQENRALAIEQKTVEMERNLILARATDVPEPIAPETTETLLDKFEDIPEIF